MLEAQSLLASILNDPESDQPRLVYADWLEEHGQIERAEFIRAQIDLARLPAWSRRSQELRWRADALLAQHGERWRAELPELPGVRWRDFERGFVSTVRVDKVKILLEHGDAIARATPVHRVELRGLKELNAERPKLADGSRSLPWLRTLRVVGGDSYYYDDEEEEQERKPLDSESTLFGTVPEIELVGLRHYDHFWRLADSGPKPHLTSLTAEGSHTAARVLAEWVAGPARVPLKRLWLGTRFVDYDSGYFQDPTLGSQGAMAIAGAPHFGGLEVLSVDRQRIGNDGLEALLTSPQLATLRELHARNIEINKVSAFRQASCALLSLDLSGNEIGSDGAEVLAASEALRGLERLALDTVELGAQGLAALTRAPFWQTLRYLDLSRNPLGRLGLEALASAPAPARLHTLLLADCDLDPKAAELLGSIPWLKDLLVLDLSFNALSRKALDGLQGGSLRSLSVAKTGADTDALAALVPQLVHLDASDNALGDKGTAALLQGGAPHLTTLRLGRNELSAQGVRALLGLELPALYALGLNGNALGAAGMQALLSAPSARQLVELDLSHCALDEGAARMLAASSELKRLRKLDMRGNVLGEKGLLALATSASLSRVTFRLDENPWRSSQETQLLLERRFGRGWWYYLDDEDDYDDYDRDTGDEDDEDDEDDGEEEEEYGDDEESEG